VNDKAEVDQYYREIDLVESLRKRGKSADALQVALANVARVHALVAWTIREYGSFDLKSIPPIEEGADIAAILGDTSALRNIRSVVESRPELAPWQEWVNEAEQDLQSVRAIRQLVLEEPGVIQSSVGKRIGIETRRASDLTYRLAQAGLLRREKSGRSYELFS
jgi:hypothetical protein